MRTVYLGTSEFAAVVLEALASGPHRPDLVVTPPDRRRGRGRKVGAPPVAESAAQLGIEVLRTADVNEPAAREAIAAVTPGALVVCAFGQIVREPLLGACEILNVHPSLLPRWRGAAPIERAIMAGDERTGVCVMRLEEGLDSGPVALRSGRSIAAGDDYGTLAPALAADGGRLMAEALDLLGAGALELEAQPEEGVTYAEKIEPAERRIDLDGKAGVEVRRVRALTPHIGAFVEVGSGDRLGVRDATAIEAGPAAGNLAAADDSAAIEIGLRSGALRVATVQPPGGRWMEAGAYLRGHGLPSRSEPV